MLGFSFSLLCRRGSDTEGTTGWTVRKPWEIAWGEGLLGRTPLGGSETEAWTSWMDRKPWESSLRRERDGSAETVDGWLGESSVGRERDGSVDTVDGWETVGNSLGRVPLGGSETEAWTSLDGQETVGNRGELRWEGAGWKRGRCGRMGNRRKYRE